MKENTYKRSQTCVYNINYHIVWAVKYRCKVLTPPIADFLKDTLKSIGEQKGFSLIECEVGLEDHVHVFISAPTTLSPSTIVKYMKGISGRKILMQFPEISDKLWRGHLWNNSYFIESIGSTNEEAIKKYIERQQTCQM